MAVWALKDHKAFGSKGSLCEPISFCRSSNASFESLNSAPLGALAEVSPRAAYAGSHADQSLCHGSPVDEEEAMF